jgi:hypothetical protein
MKKTLLPFLEKRFPEALNIYRAINNRRVFRKKHHFFQGEVRILLFSQSEIKVLSGPFKGLKYIDEIVWGSITPKWLGSYESELHPVMESIVASKYDYIIDVGSAEGYYAAGLAYRLPSSTIYAYDTDFISRGQLIRLAKLNKVQDQIKIGKYCSFDTLNQLPDTKRSVLIIDIEGHERHLLNPQTCERLKKLDILVEAHNLDKFGNTADLLISRFSSSHDIMPIAAFDRGKWIVEFNNSFSNPLNLKQLKAATKESRSKGQKWLWMKTKHFGTTSENSTVNP